MLMKQNVNNDVTKDSPIGKVLQYHCNQTLIKLVMIIIIIIIIIIIR